MANYVEPPPKRMRIAYHHRHKIQQGQQELPPHEPSQVDSQSLDKLWIESIRSICEETAIKQKIADPVIESLALESIRNAAEEFITQLCSKVRRSMLAGRRTFPIGPDFETAFDVLDLPRPDDQLQSYRTEPKINPPLLPTPPPDDAFHNIVELPSEFLGPDLSKQNDMDRYTFNTALLPPLPSSHTYKDTVVYSERETDTRKIRELATEAGKLGEQALRKLAGAVKLETALSIEPDARLVNAKRGPVRKKPVLTEEALFEETMKDLLRSERDSFELGPVVTSEKTYRMPDDVRVKRRPLVTSKTSTRLPDTEVGTTSKYNVLPPPLIKQPSTAVAVDAMDMSFEL